MKIELTQGEIKQAIAEYVSGVMGVDLRKNDLAIAFSATRLAGTIAFLEITPKAALENTQLRIKEVAPAALPGYNVDQPDVTAIDAPALAEPVADPATPEVAAAAEATATLGDPVQVAETIVEAAPVVAATTEAEGEPAQELVADTTPAPKTTATLFGKPAPTAA